jgi:hypothetical protein
MAFMEETHSRRQANAASGFHLLFGPRRHLDGLADDEHNQFRT